MIIDQVLVKVGDGHNLGTLDEWLSRSVPERIEIINAGGVQFLSGGNPVPIRDALKAIKAMKS